ncbi:MAG: hypothetical protein ACO2PO_23705 [Candidatus Calescibacterium sp.]|jgi:hypothetical protein
MKEKTLEKIKKIILEIQESGLENTWAHITLGSDQKSFSISFYFMKAPLLFSDKQFKDLVKRGLVDSWGCFTQMNSISMGSFTFKNLKEFKSKKEEIIKKLKKQVEFIKEGEKNNE